jgi:hypothetical protein
MCPNEHNSLRIALQECMMDSKRLLGLSRWAAQGSQSYRLVCMLPALETMTLHDLLIFRKKSYELFDCFYFSEKMANHDQAIDALLIKGLRNRELECVLASNCVLDWFGRTFIGQRKVIAFYQHSNTTHEHSMADVCTTEAFEDRPYHLLT